MALGNLRPARRMTRTPPARAMGSRAAAGGYSQYITTP
jgi:hypothetical protein